MAFSTTANGQSKPLAPARGLQELSSSPPTTCQIGSKLRVRHQSSGLCLVLKKKTKIWEKRELEYSISEHIILVLFCGHCVIIDKVCKMLPIIWRHIFAAFLVHGVNDHTTSPLCASGFLLDPLCVAHTLSLAWTEFSGVRWLWIQQCAPRNEIWPS